VSETWLEQTESKAQTLSQDHHDGAPLWQLSCTGPAGPPSVTAVWSQRWEMFTSCSGSFFTNCRWFCGKINRGFSVTGELFPTACQRWMSFLSNLGVRPADPLWGESSLLYAFWQFPSKLCTGLWCVVLYNLQLLGIVINEAHQWFRLIHPF
jgi:hypothetical protein